ncbi:MAG TPA: CBS domain-containing protein [Pyrinomonadaceae bacterium]|nr:CBS domain-containing protein [Pyrinomonadaceae bacterium]
MLSELRRFHVADEGGARARLRDLSVALLEGEHPAVTRLFYTCDDGQQCSLKWDAVSAVAREEKVIRVEDLGAGEAAAPDAFQDEVLLVRDVLDALVLDLQNRRATRANDLALEEKGGKLTLRAADTSARALLRRLTRGLFSEPPGHSLYDWKYVEFLRGDPSAVRSGAGEHLRITRLQPGEIATLSAAIPYMHAAELLKLLPDPLAARTLELMLPERQLQVFEEMDEEEALKMLALMSPDDAADLIGRIETKAARRYLERMPKEKSAAVIELLRYPEDTAGGIMTNEIVFVPSSLTAREAREHLRERLNETAFSLLVYAVDDDDGRHLQGLLSLRNLIVADPQARVEEFMDPYVTTLAPLESAGEAARRVINSHLPAMPVVGKDRRLLGVVTFDAAVAQAAPSSWSAQAPRKVFT